MSNFETFTPLTKGLPGTAPSRFSASTIDALATVIATGYMNDKAALGQVNNNDIVEINYSDLDTDGVITNTWGMFQVTLVGSDYNLQQLMGSSAAPVTFKAVAYAGGSATATLTITGMTSSMVASAQIQASTNAVNVQKVTPGTGTLTVLMSADPGANTVFNVIYALP